MQIYNNKKKHANVVSNINSNPTFENESLHNSWDK